MKLDWKNIDWSALLQSQVIRGNIVTIILILAALTGHNLPDSMKSQVTDLVTQILTFLASLSTFYSTYHRMTGQPENANVIVPKKPPAT